MASIGPKQWGAHNFPKNWYCGVWLCAQCYIECWFNWIPRTLRRTCSVCSWQFCKAQKQSFSFKVSHRRNFHPENPVCCNFLLILGDNV
jgi:hypothetical protein